MKDRLDDSDCYHPSRGSAPSLGSASTGFFLSFSMSSKAIIIVVGLKRMLDLMNGVVEGTTVGAEVSTWSMKS